jgi:TonB family protein
VSLAISRYWTAFLALVFVLAGGTIAASGQAPASAQAQPSPQPEAQAAAQTQIQTQAQTPEKERKVKTKVAPLYPELAKKMNVSGAVKIQIVVAPNGTVKSTKIVGGHPLLIDSALDAVKKWKYEPATTESTQLVEFKFTSGQ